MASISSLGGALGMPMIKDIPGFGGGDVGGTSPTGGGGGGGGTAQDGLGQIDSGAGTVRSAINTAASALGGGGGGSDRPLYEFKKGGYVGKGGKLNLGSGRVSTASKNKSNSNW